MISLVHKHCVLVMLHTYSLSLLYSNVCIYTNTARVVPEKVSTSSPALKTNVHWRFPTSMESCIKGFLVNATQHGDGGEGNMPVSESVPSTERLATLSNLKPSTTYHLKVVAKYEDGFQAESEEITLTTPGT